MNEMEEPMQTEAELKEQVKAGAPWLDVRYPDWATGQVDGERMAMNDPIFDRGDKRSCGCIGAQLDAGTDDNGFGTFGEFLVKNHLSEDAAVGLGLFPDDEARDDNDELAMWDDGTVDRLWRDEILSRRAARTRDEGA